MSKKSDDKILEISQEDFEVALEDLEKKIGTLRNCMSSDAIARTVAFSDVSNALKRVKDLVL